MKLSDIINEASIDFTGKTLGKSSIPADGWYEYRPMLKTYYPFLDDETVQVFPSWIDKDFFQSRKWKAHFSEYYLYLTKEQVEKVIQGKISKTKNAKEQNILDRFMGYKVKPHAMAKGVMSNLKKAKLPNGKPLYTIFLKKKGQKLDDAFFSSKTKEVQQILDKDYAAKTKGISHGKNVLYRAEARNVKEGDVIKASHAEDVRSRSGSIGLADMLYQITENWFEKYKPAGKVSRGDAVYCFATLEEAVKYTISGKRKIIAVEPLSKTTRVDMNAVHGVANMLQEIGELSDYVEDEKEAETQKAEMEKEVVKKIKNYWSGKPASGNPVWEILCAKGVRVVEVLTL